jgi:hypothetical protein
MAMHDRRLSIRLSTELLERLDAESRSTGQTRAELARTLLEEGLRMREHPGIVFRPGPVGRRPGLIDGMDVWEIARVFPYINTTDEAALRQMGELHALHIDQMQRALRYYEEYRDEIDAWIRRNDEEADRAEAAWLQKSAGTAARDGLSW